MVRVKYFVLAVVLLTGILAVGSKRVAHADNLPSLTVGSVSVVEGDAGSAVINVPVDLSAPSAAKVTVSYVVAGGTATAGADFATHKGKLTFLAGQASKVVSVKVYGDTSIEPDESVLVDLSSPVNATIASSEGTVTIVDDDSDAKTGLQVSVGDFTTNSADAGTHYAYLPITLSQPAPSSVKVNYSISCSNAVDGVDYLFKNTGTVTFLKKQQTKLLKFQIAADMTDDTAKTILESISVALGPAAVNDNSGEGTILPNTTGTPGGLPPLPVKGLERDSVNSDGIEGESPSPGVCTSQSFGSFGASVSADGRYVAFISDALNLVPDDNNGEWDAFVRDRLTGTTERVSVASDGTETAPNGPSGAPYPGANSATISRDGRFVTFFEWRSLGGYPGYQFFIHDRQTGTTVPLLSDLAGHPVDAVQLPISMSADDRYVTFESCGDSSGVLVPSDLDPPHPPEDGAACDAFLYDRTTSSYTLISNPPDGSPSDGMNPTISADGRSVAFVSSNADYVAGDTNGCADAFVRDMVTGTFDRINVTTAGAQDMPDPTGECDPWLRSMSLSDNGQYVAFVSGSWTLAGLSSPASWSAAGNNTFVRDRVAQTTTMVNPAGPVFTTAPAISGDGAYVSYSCSWCDVDTAYYVTNVATGDTVRASELPDGTQGDASDYSYEASTQALSSDGTYAVFSSSASNLVGDDSNDTADVFIKRVH